MKHARVITITMAAVFLSMAAAQGFRGMPGGSTEYYVKSHESFTLVSDQSENLIFSGTVANLDVYAAYQFVGNKLARAVYLFNENHSNENQYLDDYYSVESILTAKYGAPDVADEMDWNNDLYKGDTSNYGMAIAVGDLSMFSQWNTPSEKISEEIYGDNYDVVHRIVYLSNEYGATWRNAQDSKNQSAF